jgi:Uma2 family endonuclease
MVGIPLIDTGPMTVDEFYAFTDTRPADEKWELIGGEPVLSASPLDVHQWIVRNVFGAFLNWERELNPYWAVLPGLGVRISDRDRPEPDVLVFPSKHHQPEGRRDRNDVIVVFEVLSPSTEGRDLGWKCKAPTLAFRRSPTTSRFPRDTVEVIVFACDDNFEGWKFRSPDEAIELRSLGVSLAIAEIYRDIPLPAQR